jgi:DNA-binding LacI/PurR family transcriptional regulator
MKLSVKEIAKRAGTSTATVSRVLSDPDYRCRSQELRQKIWEIANEMNYVPNEVAIALKKGTAVGRKETFYVNVLMTRSGDAETDPFFEEVLRILISELLKQSGILANVWRIPDLANDSTASSVQVSREVEHILSQSKGKNDAIVFLGKSKDQVYKKLSGKFRAMVAIQRNRPGYLIDEVLGNGVRIGHKAVEYLYSLGHRKIGYVGDTQTDLCFQGYVDALREFNLEYNSKYIIEATRRPEESVGIMRQIMNLKDGPTGIYCPCDYVAIGMLNALKRYRNRFYTPSIISSDGIEDNQYCEPMLTSIEYPKQLMVKYAVNLLMDRLQRGHSLVTHVEVESQLIIRDSCTSYEDGVMFDYCI